MLSFNKNFQHKSLSKLNYVLAVLKNITVRIWNFTERRVKFSNILHRLRRRVVVVFSKYDRMFVLFSCVCVCFLLLFLFLFLFPNNAPTWRLFTWQTKRFREIYLSISRTWKSKKWRRRSLRVTARHVEGSFRDWISNLL